MDFQTLINEVREAGRKPGTPPVTITEIAKRCGVSRPHLYHLMSGQMDPADWTIEKIAAGLKRPVKVVADALRRTRKAVAS